MINLKTINKDLGRNKQAVNTRENNGIKADKVINFVFSLIKHRAKKLNFNTNKTNRIHVPLFVTTICYRYGINKAELNDIVRYLKNNYILKYTYNGNHDYVVTPSSAFINYLAHNKAKNAKSIKNTKGIKSIKSHKNVKQINHKHHQSSKLVHHFQKNTNSSQVLHLVYKHPFTSNAGLAKHINLTSQQIATSIHRNKHNKNIVVSHTANSRKITLTKKGLRVMKATYVRNGRASNYSENKPAKATNKHAKTTKRIVNVSHKPVLNNKFVPVNMAKIDNPNNLTFSYNKHGHNSFVKLSGFDVNKVLVGRSGVQVLENQSAPEVIELNPTNDLNNPTVIKLNNNYGLHVLNSKGLAAILNKYLSRNRNHYTVKISCNVKDGKIIMKI